jgi:branched-chain amino acid transport system permease protein
MPDGIIPAVTSLRNRFRPQAASIREVTAAELAAQRRAAASDPGADADEPEPVTEGARR